MRLKHIRIAKGISVPQLAAMTGLHRRTIEEIEKRDDCTVSNALLFAEVLGVTLDQLCAPKDEPADESE